LFVSVTNSLVPCYKSVILFLDNIGEAVVVYYDER